jgi:hypothetical protein
MCEDVELDVVSAEKIADGNWNRHERPPSTGL